MSLPTVRVPFKFVTVQELPGILTTNLTGPEHCVFLFVEPVMARQSGFRIGKGILFLPPPSGSEILTLQPQNIPCEKNRQYAAASFRYTSGRASVESFDGVGVRDRKLIYLTQEMYLPQKMPNAEDVCSACEIDPTKRLSVIAF